MGDGELVVYMVDTLGETCSGIILDTVIIPGLALQAVGRVLGVQYTVELGIVF